MNLGGGTDTLRNLSANSFNLRDFAYTNGDGVRGTESVAVADFGAGTDLPRLREQRVVARDSVFRYRDPGGDPQRVGRALGAEYIVTGSIRRQGTKLRLTAQLTDAASGTQHWAERFDRDTEDILTVADAMVATIAAALAGRARGGRQDHLDWRGAARRPAGGRHRRRVAAGRGSAQLPPQ